MGNSDYNEIESGRRHPAGFTGTLLTGVLLAWSLFQLWYASPFPFLWGVAVFNDTEARSVHLAFALFLAFTAFPARRRSPVKRIPTGDWLLALGASLSAAYLYLFQDALAGRMGAATTIDIAVALVGMVLLLEATRRTLGPPLMVVAALFLVYTFAGPHMPSVIAHKGASLHKALSHQWLGTEGVFGVALGVSTGFVFLYVLFGALLERAGAGRFFIRLAFALLGRYRGGPAKAAVVASGMSGLISGSSIANVVTTGTFTIPLMKRAGFPATKAGAVEVAASTNGQLTPPIMGAAAFLMVEYVGISYLEVIKHALLPALISYIALLYIVHLEAVKAGMKGVSSPRRLSLLLRLSIALGTFIGLMLLGALLYYGVAWVRDWLGSGALWLLSALALMAYVVLLVWAAGIADLDDDGLDSPEQLPGLGHTLRGGLYFLLPVVVLVWCLAVERLSPGLSAFWATLFMVMIVVTQRPLKAWFRRQTMQPALVQGFLDLREAMVNGARNMVGIGVATAAAGIVVGTVTLTGIGLVMTEFIDFISGGSLLLMLLFTALISLLLGMGLPTTANYIVVSTLMAPVIVALGAEHGLAVPLIAVHLFVFYFGILADDTPPVGLAAFAAAGIARADPLRTGIQGFAYDIRTAILPFMFIFNTDLLLIDIASWWQLLLTVASAILAMLCFAAATQRFWLVPNRWWETLALLLLAFSLFRPGFWWDRLYPPEVRLAGSEVVAVAGRLQPGDDLVLRAEGMTLEGDQQERRVMLPISRAEEATQRLADAGITLRHEKGEMWVDSVMFGSAAERAGLDLDWRITAVITPAERPPKQWLLLPLLLLLLGLGFMQRRRQTVLQGR